MAGNGSQGGPDRHKQAGRLEGRRLQVLRAGSHGSYALGLAAGSILIVQLTS